MKAKKFTRERSKGLKYCLLVREGFRGFIDYQTPTNWHLLNQNYYPKSELELPLDGKDRLAANAEGETRLSRLDVDPRLVGSRTRVLQEAFLRAQLAVAVGKRGAAAAAAAADPKAKWKKEQPYQRNVKRAPSPEFPELVR